MFDQTRRTETIVKKTVLDQFAPDVASAIFRQRVVNARRVVDDRDLYWTDPLGDLCFLVVTVGR
jgi:hypothetical protein